MNSLLVINTLSGNSAKVREEELIEKYAVGNLLRVVHIRSTDDTYSVDGVDRLIICGGDGTLNNALNICRDKDIDILYLPFGTFNETAKSQHGSGIYSLAKLGRIGERDFSYVAAAGSFTDLGHVPSAKAKRRLKVFAYFSRVLDAYKVHRIPAEIRIGNEREKGVYTLIMLSNATRCFGFRFNRLHRENSEELQLLLIKAPKKDNLWGRIKMFFPFFRAFFLGFRKEYKCKNMRFCSVKNAEISLSEATPFCVDGEIIPLVGDMQISKPEHQARVFLIKE